MREAFEPTLSFSVVVHIDYRNAPLVIQRFGDIKKLVEQTLDPMGSAYFNNIAQKKTLIELLQDRSDIKEQAGDAMRAKTLAYNLELQEVLIGIPRAAAGNNQIEQVLQQLRQREVAEKHVAAFQKQKVAAEGQRDLREAESRAKRQTVVNEPELSMTVQENQGEASLKRATQEAEQTTTLVRAGSESYQDHRRMRGGERQSACRCEADLISRTGLATAETMEKQAAASAGRLKRPPTLSS